MNVVTIVGARPQFIKAAMISHAIARFNAKHEKLIVCEKILHTGQHFDDNMSQVFFDELQIPVPTWHLNSSGNVDEMSQRIVDVLKEEKIDYILVFGDTNSTLAGALAAEKLNIPLIHVEAGLRSFNNAMREEYNRIETDKRSQYLFCPTRKSVENLSNENIGQNIFHVGDVMYDAAIFYGQIAENKSQILVKNQLQPKSYYLATIHRAETADNVDKLQSIFAAFVQIATDECPIILPIHPRTKQVIEREKSLRELLAQNSSIRIIEPVSYIDMVALEKHALRIITDSGGVQKEAYFHKTPCITLRDETEWTETVTAGWNVLVGTDTDKIISAISHEFACNSIDEYGCGNTADVIVETLFAHRLLILTDAVTPPLWAPRMRNLAINLQKRGWQVKMMAEGLPQFPYQISEFDLQLCYYYKNQGVWMRLRWILDQLFYTKERFFQRFVEKKCNVSDFDVILCSSFNLFPLLSAQRLAKKYHKPLIVDLRDITEQWGETSSYFQHRSRLLGNLETWLKKIYEKRIIRNRNKVLKKVQGVTTVSPWHANFLSKFHSYTKLIYNGFDEQIYFRQDVKSKNFTIVYTGKLYEQSIRNPELLFEALHDLQNPEICVNWYIGKNGREWVEKMAKKYGVESQMRYYDYVPNAQIPTLLHESSIVLVLTNKETEQGPHGIMTTKFFEALGVEKPVLCVRSDEACLAQAIAETNAGIAAKTVEEVKQFILEKYAEWQKNGFTHQAVNQKEKQKFSRQKQAEEFERILLSNLKK